MRLAEKFKELPAGVRGAVPLVLPPTYAPPPLPLEEMVRIAKEKQQRGGVAHRVEAPRVDLT